MYNNPLFDREFLKELDKYRHRETYARITLLTFDELPIEYIEGKITGGSINIDGASALRRSCSLTMITNDLKVNIYKLGLERKFKLEIGLKNKINSNYPDIIWFKQGVFIVTGVNSSRSTNNYTISISGKDKMCLLNGDVAGSLPSSVDFGVVTSYSEDGQSIYYEDVKIKDIIFQAVETYGNELPHNIVINDLDTTGFELLEYRGDTPIYMFKDSSGQCVNMTLDENFLCYKEDGSKITVSNIPEKMYDNFSSIDLGNNNALQIKFKNDPEEKDPIFYTVVKFEFGNAVGYRQTDLTFAGDLIGNVGESLTSILDKIKNMLVNFEYFYDIDGRFIFQKKKTYVDEQWRPEAIEDSNGEYFENNKIISQLFYNLEDNDIIISFNNNPNFSNVKNDYSIWGVREGVNGGEIPIHLRYAIDTKPTKYTTYQYDYDIDDEGKPIKAPQITYIASQGTFQVDNEKEIKIVYCDWREIIYQMALDYSKFHDTKEDFYAQIINNNKDENGVPLYPTGRTGYEQYYTDILGFWREIYFPSPEVDFAAGIDGDFSNKTGEKGFFQQVLLTESLYKKNQYYKKRLANCDTIGRFPIYELCSSRIFDDSAIYYEKTEDFLTEKNGKILSNFSEKAREYPNRLNFWIDFLETEGELGKYSVRAIGQRSKNVNDSDVTSIYYRKVPQVIFVNNKDGIKDKKSDYTYMNTSTQLENCLSVSSQGKSAWEEMETYLNENTFCLETVSITAIPIFYIEPNVRISIKDSESKVNGEYVLDKITLPLTYNGTMSITATKIVDDIY